MSYVPRAHVQFLEQAGIRVVPVDYRLSREERFALLEQVNGLYVPGDSQVAVQDEMYKDAFVQAMAYMENKVHEEKVHFPVFLMGNGLQTLARAKRTKNQKLENMTQQANKSLSIQMLGMPDQTYFFDQMTRDERQAVFHSQSKFFNRQNTGLSLKHLENEPGLRRHIKPLATYV